MSALTDIHGLTKMLYDHLNKRMPEDEGREEYIERVEFLLSQRQEQIKQLNRPTGSEEENLAEEVLTMNQVINQRIEATKGEIQMNINTLKKRKQTRMKYETPYNGPTADGVFFDSKN